MGDSEEVAQCLDQTDWPKGIAKYQPTVLPEPRFNVLTPNGNADKESCLVSILPLVSLESQSGQLKLCVRGAADEACKMFATLHVVRSLLAVYGDC